MSAGAVVLWRHGQTEWNRLRRLQGQADIELEAVGVAQAEAAAEVLATLPVAKIVTSDLKRAVATSAPLAARTGLTAVHDPRLRERSFGEWEGLDHAQMSQGWPAQYEQWVAGEQPDDVGVEPRGAVGTRVAQAIAEHAATLEEGEVLVAVTHGAALGAGTAALLGQDAEVWHGISGVGNCHWTVLEPRRRGAPAWRLAGHNVGVS